MFKSLKTIYGTVVIPYAGRNSVVNFDITPEPRAKKSKRSLKKTKKEKAKRVPIYTLNWE